MCCWLLIFLNNIEMFLRVGRGRDDESVGCGELEQDVFVIR
jgi:hypothetical protein